MKSFAQFNEGVKDQMIGKLDKYDEWINTIQGVASELGAFLNVRTIYVDDAAGEMIVLFGNIPQHTIFDWFENTQFKYKVYRINKSSDNITTVEIYKKSKVNESVRDKMTPKSKEDIRSAFKTIVDKIDTPLTMYPMKIWKEVDKICKMFKETRDNLYFIDMGDDNFEVLEELFESLIIDDNILLADKIIKTGEGEWYCYPNVKLAHYIPDEMSENLGWIFSKDFINNSLNESVRDKMTPKSKEDIISSIDDMINDGRKLSKSLVLILNQTQNQFVKFWHPKDVMSELFSTIDYEMNLKTVSNILDEVDKRIAFGMDTIYFELWNSLTEDIKKEALKTLLSKYEII